MRKGWTKPCP